jgi:hypothetical protein
VRRVSVRRASALAAGALLLLAGCGGSSGSKSSSSTPSASAPAATHATTTSGGLTIAAIDPTKYLRASSVGFGQGPPPPIAAVVRRAAARAGCRVRSDTSAVGIHLELTDLVPLHVNNPDYSHVPRPPTNGHHYPVWANWGFYTTPVPYKFEVHNLEHGGIAVHLGLAIKRKDGLQVVKMWAASPPYMLIVPGLPADVPVNGVTVTSWQRAMICKTWNARTLAAIVTYRDTYRGTGPEHLPSINSGASVPGLPTPTLPDPTGQ